MRGAGYLIARTVSLENRLAREKISRLFEFLNFVRSYGYLSRLLEKKNYKSLIACGCSLSCSECYARLFFKEIPHDMGIDYSDILMPHAKKRGVVYRVFNGPPSRKPGRS